METTKTKYGICRFSNISGVTCYMNSILHILQQIPIFADYIYTASFSDQLRNNCNNEEEMIKSKVSYELYRLFSASMNNDDIAIKPTSFRNIIGLKNDIWTEISYQDSQEFLNFLISTLEEEIGTKVTFIPKYVDNNYSSYLNLLSTMAWQKFQEKEYSPLKDIFNGMTLIQSRCNCCSNITSNFEPFTTLQVAIPNNDNTQKFTIFECLNHLVKEEQLDKDNMYCCEMCGLKNKGHKKSFLWRTPKVLIIHINRFKVNNFGIKTQKLINQIEYPIYDFNVSEYIHPKSPFKNKCNYDLIGVNLHKEFGFSGVNAGHYTSLVKNRLDNNWYLFNDEHEPVKATKKEHLQNRNAYLLFYYRKD